MKQFHVPNACLIILLLFCGRKLFAQDSIRYHHLQPVVVRATTIKVPEKVWDHFSNYFTGAFVRKWYKVNKRYLVKFMLDETENRALFTKRGTLVYHISYGYENNLEDRLLTQIKDSYTDYAVTRAIKVSENNRVIWVVTLEDRKQLLLIRLEDGELEEVERMNKKNGGEIIFTNKQI